MGEGKGFDARRKAAFVAAVERGATIEDSARAAGVCLATLYKERRENAAFAEAWDEAVAVSAAPELIRPVNGRKLQKRKCRRARFTPERKGIFLAHFAATCDATAAAEAAGVADATVYNHRRTDPDFAEGWQEALEQSYARLEAEVVRQRLDAVERMKAARDSAEIEPVAAIEFERAVKLLDKYRRRGGGVGARSWGRPHLKRWSFDEAMAALERKLQSLGYQVPEEAAPPSGGHHLPGLPRPAAPPGSHSPEKPGEE